MLASEWRGRGATKASASAHRKIQHRQPSAGNKELSTMTTVVLLSGAVVGLTILSVILFAVIWLAFTDVRQFRRDESSREIWMQDGKTEGSKATADVILKIENRLRALEDAQHRHDQFER
jgi:hypothetical protein